MNKSIVKGLLDFLESYQSFHPCPTHPTLAKTWQESFEFATSEIPWGEIDPTLTENQIQKHIDFVVDVFMLYLQSSTSSSEKWQTMTLAERYESNTRIKTYPQIPQRSPAWYAQAKTVLTASEFATIFGTDRAVSQLALQKVYHENPPEQTNRAATSTPEMSAFDWGIRFEPVVKQVLTAMWGLEIAEIGRLVHPTDSRLAASPDGLIELATDPKMIGRLLEIKCPVRRELNGKIPFEYWCQMQIQMEVADVDECEYVEVKLISPYKSDLSTYVRPAEGSIGQTYNATVWLFQSEETCEMKYAYTHTEKEDFERIGWVCIETIPWHVGEFFSSTVARDRAWYESTLDKRSAFWEKVAVARKGELVLAPAKVRNPVVNVCRIVDDLI